RSSASAQENRTKARCDPGVSCRDLDKQRNSRKAAKERAKKSAAFTAQACVLGLHRSGLSSERFPGRASSTVFLESRGSSGGYSVSPRLPRLPLAMGGRKTRGRNASHLCSLDRLLAHPDCPASGCSGYFSRITRSTSCRSSERPSCW